MSIEVAQPEPIAHEPLEQYRPLATSAVASLLVGLLSVLALFDWSLLLIPVVGVLLSLYAFRTIRGRAGEMRGLALAKAGLAVSAVLLIAAPTFLSAMEYLEVPEGYERVEYWELQPDPTRAGQAIPPRAKELDGKKIFIKGYPYPGQKQADIQEFLLVRDQGDCCFGGDPKITDRILVKLADPLRLTYKPRLHALAGTFHVQPMRPVGGDAKGGVFYHLEADHLK